MDDVKIGEILLPGSEEEQARQEKTVRSRFWPVMKKAVRHIPFSRDVIAAFYCATDRQTPLRVRGILLAALAYFVMPFDAVPDFLGFLGFTDDIAVLTMALSLIDGHIREHHYAAADQALADGVDGNRSADR
ncbi:YkvA family protein [Allorhizobium sp. BGMRC 0089]|uniref:YkvA family protein n=1 Tax=Allorhizobium sonneratiae TaxID=2934936 RepID=UPI0020344B94|nr:YkvA family protein [Allorhizobium sonneratiae]MCM2293371.1 YkvA family protein [Allorhizobium sonneratiae]